MTKTKLATFSADDIQALQPAMKIGLLATVNPEGLPHLTLLASLRANTPTQLTFGQFIEGTSKGFLRQNPRAGFLVMTLDKNLWRGKATFTHTARQGPEFELYNNQPMFRYNAYFGVHTVYYLDLVEQSGRSALPMGRVVAASLQTMAARAVHRPAGEAMNAWTQALLNKLGNLKFLAYVDGDGYPCIVPVIQAQAAGAGEVLFAASVYGEAVKAIPRGAPAALLGMSLQMEDVLLRGEYQGLRRVAGQQCGSIRVDWVYNPMPPTPQQVYPPLPLEPITSW
ncbi:MAG: pyridoxamine 5'-phosphate oxidase family protein [Anaerolineae bacterium]|jgi:hypothetical protein|nr:pyridoxamine 5'-phosphate oxidase family protein [Anaerolineae bacterium]